MNNVNDILNKTYQRIGSTSGDTFHTEQLDGEFVICSNGARIKLSTLLSEFHVAGSPINENTISQISATDINPDTFFSTPSIVPPIAETKTVRDTASIMNGQVISNNNNAANNQQQPPPSFLNLPAAESEMQFSTGNVVNPNPNQEIVAPTINVSNRLPEWDMFDRIKKTEEVQLNVSINITLPKARHIDAINDMYQTKFSAYLAKQYLTNVTTIQNQIREAIEEWMNIELNGGKRKKVVPSKTIKPKKVKKKPDTAKIEIELSSGTTAIVQQPIEAGSAAALFGQPTIKKDVTKLAAIYDDEQYQAAKQYFANLPETHKDYFRFENMISVWEDEKQISK